MLFHEDMTIDNDQVHCTIALKNIYKNSRIKKGRVIFNLNLTDLNLSSH